MNKNKLKEVLSVQSYSGKTRLMFDYILNECKDIDCNVFTDNGNIYITKGEANLYPCVIAHTDTVHAITDDLTVIELNGKLTGFNAVKMQQTGIGGDDKVGIFIALNALQEIDNIKIAFFEDEEIGCIGSYDADMSFFDDCSFVLQCDRKGNGDFITNASGIPLSSKSFKKAIKPILKHYGYRHNTGLMSDVMALKENGLPISCANISCGYYNPHSHYEYVDIYDVERCLNLVLDIIYQLGNVVFIHNYSYSFKPATKYDYDYKYNAALDAYESYLKGGDKIEKEFCESCCEEVQTGKAIYNNDYNVFLCSKCNDSLQEELDRTEHIKYNSILSKK